MSTQERQEGYYWVKDVAGTWRVAEWDGTMFSFNGAGYSADLFADIDERRMLMPDEQSKVYYSNETIRLGEFFTALPSGELVPHTEANLKRLQGERANSMVVDAALSMINASFPDALDAYELELKSTLERIGVYSKYYYANGSTRDERLMPIMNEGTIPTFYPFPNGGGMLVPPGCSISLAGEGIPAADYFATMNRKLEDLRELKLQERGLIERVYGSCEAGEPLDTTKVDPYKVLEEGCKWLREQTARGLPPQHFMFGGKVYDMENLSDSDREELKGLFDVPPPPSGTPPKTGGEL